MQTDVLVYGTFAGLFGLAVGSFVNVVVHRLPSGGVRALSGRSHCPRCDAGIPWFDNIPLLSWLLLRGKCRSCRAPISPRYPAIEALCAALFVACWGLRPDLAAHPGYDAIVLIRWTALAALLALSAIDLELRVLPDEITVGGMVLVPIAAAAVPGLLEGTWSEEMLRSLLPEAHVRSLAVSLAGLVVGAGTVAAIRAVATSWFSRTLEFPVDASSSDERLDAFLARQRPRRSKRQVRTLAEEGLLEIRRRGASRAEPAADPTARIETGDVVRLRIVREAMGFGDVKLQGAIGALVGPEGSLIALALASFGGAIVGSANLLRLYALLRRRAARRRRASRARLWEVARVRGGTIPFGPFLAGGAAAQLLARDRVLALLHLLR